MPRHSVLWFCGLLACASPAVGQVAMPDPSQIAGRALPAPELADGTVSVRLVREAIGNNIVGHEVTVTARGTTRTAKTDENGRAQVTGLPAGASATAEATVDGERLTSQPFDVPARGGIRVILIAGLEAARQRRDQEAAAAAEAPPAKGSVVFGGDSRIVFEFQNDALRAFYLLEIVNTARTRVDIGGPLIINMPRGGAAPRIMEGSFAGATAMGDHVTIAGPFPPGTSSVQIGFSMIYTGDEVTVTQAFPAPLQKLTVVAEKIGRLELHSPYFTDHRDVRAGDGTPFILAGGGSLPAGQELTLRISNLPSHPTWPRLVALLLVAVILGIGGWLAFGRRSQDDGRRRLVAQRDSLLGELAKLEEQHRNGRVEGERYRTRRQRLLGELERIYGELDEAA